MTSPTNNPTTLTILSTIDTTPHNTISCKFRYISKSSIKLGQFQHNLIIHPPENTRQHLNFIPMSLYSINYPHSHPYLPQFYSNDFQFNSNPFPRVNFTPQLDAEFVTVHHAKTHCRSCRLPIFEGSGHNL